MNIETAGKIARAIWPHGTVMETTSLLLGPELRFSVEKWEVIETSRWVGRDVIYHVGFWALGDTTPTWRGKSCSWERAFLQAVGEERFTEAKRKAGYEDSY